MNHRAVMHPLLTPASARPSLREDTRGAVMVTGLFMAFFLVGALWFVIGIGDAVIFRDRMQEAADHGAFTSAALQAKGMNFISAVNLVMLLMVIVHVVLGIIHDVLLAVCIFTGVGCGVYVPAMRAYQGYAKIMKPILTGLAYAEKAAAWGYPWLGTVKGHGTGQKYGDQGRIAAVNVVVAGPSNIPGLVGEGLPVKAEPFGYLCEKVAGLVLDFGKNIAESTIPQWLRWVINPPGPFGGNAWDKIWDFYQGVIGAGVRIRYCNDLTLGAADPILQRVRQGQRDGQAAADQENQERTNYNRDNAGGTNADGSPREQKPLIERPEFNTTSATTATGGWSSLLDPGFDRGWGNDGPLLVTERNGSDGHQVWAVNLDAKYRETSEKKVTLGKGPTASRGGLDGTELDQGGTYYAQAEFYFDCENKWNADDCNGGFRDNNASFAIKWRARLRRVELPNLGAILARFGAGQIANQIGELVGPALEDLVQGPLSAVGIQALQTRINNILEGLQQRIAGAIPGPTADGIYH